MRRLFPLLVLLALGAGGCRQPDPVDPQANQAQANQAAAEEAPAQLLDRSQAGKPAPSASFLKPDGSRVSLADFRGKPVLLNLWATWCAPCVTEMPLLDTLAGRQKDLQVLTVSQDKAEHGKKVQDFFAQEKFAHLQPYLDPESALMDAFVAQSLPTTILFDKDGKEVWRLMGPEEWTGKKAAALIAEAG